MAGSVTARTTRLRVVLAAWSGDHSKADISPLGSSSLQEQAFAKESHHRLSLLRRSCIPDWWAADWCAAVRLSAPPASRAKLFGGVLSANVVQRFGMADGAPAP